MGQIVYFALGVLSGFVSGVVGEPMTAFSHCGRSKIMQSVFDGMYWLIAFFVYVILSVLFRLPNFRLYFIVANFCGMWLYRNSFRRILAILEKRLYNRYRRSCGVIGSRLSKIRCRMKSLKK